MRRLAGVMLALYAVGVFPANIKHAIEGVDLPPAPNSWWYHGPRLGAAAGADLVGVVLLRRHRLALPSTADPA